MLERLRKSIESLLSGALGTETPEETVYFGEDSESEEADDEPASPAEELEAAIFARKEARKREARFILSERIHNQAATLKSELRNRLLQQIQSRLEQEAGSQSLQNLLQVTLDPAFTQQLDRLIEHEVDGLLAELKDGADNVAASAALIPSRSDVASELKTYRDQTLRNHLLEQLEVFALPSTEAVFPDGKVSPGELHQAISSYGRSCREALDRFFRSVEMSLLTGARPGIRLDATVVRDRLVTAQYRNGYRLLEERFRTIYSKLADLQVRKPARVPEEKPLLDRQVVDEIIVPLAHFIKDRSEPEPGEALKARAELFREIVDTVVAGSEQLPRSAEAIKPLLRRSIVQARPLALESFPYLRSNIESLKPEEVHRATALLHLLEVLVQPEIDEQTLQAAEQSVRLNKAQYHLHVHLWRSYPGLLKRLPPLERIHSEDADFLRQIIEFACPPEAAVDDLAIRLGYLPMPENLPNDSRGLLRLLAVLTLSRNELTSWSFLHAPQPPEPKDLKHFAKAVVTQLRPTSVGADDRQHMLGAVPLPVDLSRALARIGYHSEHDDRLARFRKELQSLIAAGTAQELERAIHWIVQLRNAVHEERVSLGLVGTEGDPYVSEVWLKESGVMLGLLFYRGAGFGEAPIEKIARDPAEGNRSEINNSLRRQLGSQAVIYQSFRRLFGRDVDLPRNLRQGLPSYLKTTYEKIEPNRFALTAHLRNARLLLKRIDEFARIIVEADRGASGEATTVHRIVSGLLEKVARIHEEVEATSGPTDLTRLAKEYKRVVHHLNVVLLHSVNPWLDRQTRGLATEFDYHEDEVVEALRHAAASRGFDWKSDIEGYEAHRIRGTLGCRALLRLADGSTKVVLLEYDRRRRAWQAKHFGPRLTDVVDRALRAFGRSVPADYDEKYEQPTFSLEQQLCRFLLVGKGRTRIEATLVLDSSDDDPWKVVFLKWNDEVLIDRQEPLVAGPP